MEIISSVNNFISPMQVSCRNQNLTFGSKPLKKDVFEVKSSSNIDDIIKNLEDDTVNISELEEKAPHLYENVKNGEEEIIRKTKLLNRQTGKYEDAYITAHKFGFICIHSNDNALGSIILQQGGNNFLEGKHLTNVSKDYKKNNFLEVVNLETRNLGHDASKYRGIGTELIKQAIIESYKQNNGGRIALIADNRFDEGRAAQSFYEHIGMKHSSDSKLFDAYVFDESDIPNFLKK